MAVCALPTTHIDVNHPSVNTVEPANLKYLLIMERLSFKILLECLEPYGSGELKTVRMGLSASWGSLDEHTNVDWGTSGWYNLIAKSPICVRFSILYNNSPGDRVLSDRGKQAAKIIWKPGVQESPCIVTASKEAQGFSG
jgi:hypothetical protein